MIALSTKGVGGGGTVGTSSVSEDTLAEIRNNSEVNAYGNKPAEDGTTGVGVAAENDSIVNMYGVNAGLGKAAGIGANVAVSQVNNSAVARIDNAKINQDLSGGNDENMLQIKRLTFPLPTRRSWKPMPARWPAEQSGSACPRLPLWWKIRPKRKSSTVQT